MSKAILNNLKVAEGKFCTYALFSHHINSHHALFSWITILGYNDKLTHFLRKFKLTEIQHINPNCVAVKNAFFVPGLVQIPTDLKPFLVQSFFETSQYCDEWRKFTSVSQ